MDVDYLQIKLRTQSVVSQGTVYRVDGVKVVKVTLADEELVVKTADVRNHRELGLLDYERRTILCLKELGFKCMLPLHNESIYGALVFPLAEDIESHMEKCYHELTIQSKDYGFRNFDLNAVTLYPELCDLLIKYFVELFESVRSLHNLGFSHGDIRPSNIVIFDGSAYLIDWATCHKQKDLIFVCQKFDIYLPDEMIENSFSGFYKPKWDYLGLLFSLLGVIKFWNTHFEVPEKSFGDADDKFF